MSLTGFVTMAQASSGGVTDCSSDDLGRTVPAGASPSGNDWSSGGNPSDYAEYPRARDGYSPRGNHGNYGLSVEMRAAARRSRSEERYAELTFLASNDPARSSRSQRLPPGSPWFLRPPPARARIATFGPAGYPDKGFSETLGRPKKASPSYDSSFGSNRPSYSRRGSFPMSGAGAGCRQTVLGPKNREAANIPGPGLWKPTTLDWESTMARSPKAKFGNTHRETLPLFHLSQEKDDKLRATVPLAPHVHHYPGDDD